MLEFAKQAFEQNLSEVSGGSGSEAAHLRQLAKSKGQDPDDVCPLPELNHFQVWIWQTFFDLSQARTSGLVPHPIQFTEIAAWAGLHGIELEPWEVDAIAEIDNVFLTVVSEKSKAARAQREK